MLKTDDHRFSRKAHSPVDLLPELAPITGLMADTYSYDAENRLVEIQASSFTNQMAYDGLGIRLSLASNGVTKRFVLDVAAPLSQILAETDAAGTITAYYVYGLGLVSRISATENISFYHFDPYGTTIALTDGAGTITDKYVSDSFAVLHFQDPHR